MPFDKTFNRLTNGVLFIDGKNTYGKIEEIQNPEVKAKMIDHKVSGMNGTLELPSGLDKMEASCKSNGPFPELQAISMDPWTAHTFMFRGSMENFTGQDRTSQVPYVCTWMGTCKGSKIGDIKQHENMDITYNFNITYVKLEVNGVVKFEIDIINNIHKVNGVDLLATYKNNVGL